MVLGAEDGCNHPQPTALVLTAHSYVGGRLILGRFGAYGTRVSSETYKRHFVTHPRLRHVVSSRFLGVSQDVERISSL
eukprot:4010427-Prymnesium_polylepis.1